jgi:hypothetical protein
MPTITSYTTKCDLTEAVAEAAAAALVGAMATDAWQTARAGFAQLLGRGDRGRQDLADRRLEQAAVQVAQADHDNQDRIRGELLSAWQVRLRDLLEEHPEIVEELRTLTAQVQSRLPAAQQAWAQQNLARNHGTVYGVQAGDQHIHYDATLNPPPSRPGAVDRPAGGDVSK